jgi:Putative metal-binding motif/RTX calcium-binding nonapeptide repeat (4 copies)
MRLALALLVALLLPATASASTIRTDAGHIYFDGGAGDQVWMSVNSGFDQDLASTAIFFTGLAHTPAHVNPTTTDASCRASAALGYKCASPTDKEVDVTAGSQDDFVRVLAAGSLLVLHAGAGNDRAFVDNGTRITAFGEAGNDDLAGSTSFDTLDGGSGDDTLTPRGFGDIVNGGADFDTVQMPAGGVTVTLDDVANDGKTGENENIHSDVEKVAGGSGNDQLDGSNGPNALDGGDGNDTLTGLGGADTLTGGGGNDVMQARDGGTDTVSCGTGDDRAVVDPADQVASDCETVEYADSDHDGVDVRTDCNDANPAIHPGAADVPGNGIDEDCSGADAALVNTNPGTGTGGGTVTDADHDGASPPLDCDDGNAARHPGAADVPGNGVDEDCSGADAPVPPVPYHVTHRWDLAGTWSRVVQLKITQLPAGAKLTVTCEGRGCPFMSRSTTKGDLTKMFKRRKLSKGVVVDVKIGAPGYKSVTVRFTVKGKKKLPQQRQLPA